VSCAACGADNPAGKRFCRDCGAPLTTRCPSCGTVVDTDQRFCGDCAAPLQPDSGPASPVPVAPKVSPTVVERRVCSVLFCDLVGFTPLSESRDPEEVRDLLSRYFEVARTIIGRYGGVVEKFIGDAVMAVWGTPVASEQDAERAVRAALDVVSAVTQLGADAGVDGLAARAGVVTGEVAVTLGAVHEGMVAGDKVNTAARVQSLAEAASVLVDESTKRLASSALEFADFGHHVLKGKAEPQRLWQATRVISGAGGSQRVDGLEAPLMGRDAELQTVKQLFHAAAERRVPRLVLVSGPAGVGKSRLGWEFEKYIDGLAGTVAWHRGRCPSYGDGVAFWALAAIMRQRFGIAEDDPTEVAAARLESGVREIVLDAGERSYIGIRVARLLGVPFPGDSEAPMGREELFAGWRMLFERLAAVDPVLLLVEDAQYADAGLLDFLDHLIDWARGLPIFILVFARPELDQVRAGFAAGRNRTSLTLDPLDAASMDRLVNALVPGMQGAAQRAITLQAEGIPLFALETVRSLIDRDVVQPIDGVYRLVSNVGQLEVPESLHALMATRLDSLPPPVRHLVADAAVLGGMFSPSALAAVSGSDQTTVAEALVELVRREVFEISADPLSPERGAYQFAQGMLRQVAYDTLSLRDRKARHLAVAAQLRATYPDDGEEVIEVVAQHYLDSLAARPHDPDVPAITVEAIKALIRAAHRALRTGAPSRAADNYSSAATLVSRSQAPDPDHSAAELWQLAADVAIRGMDARAALEHASHSREAYETEGNLRAAAKAQSMGGTALRLLGRHREAREQLSTALQGLTAERDEDTVFALCQSAALETFAGTPAADRLTAEALELGRIMDVDSILLFSLLGMRGICLDVLGRRVEAASYFREAASIADRLNDRLRQGQVLLNLAYTLGYDDPKRAISVAHEAISFLRHAGNRPGLALATSNLVSILLEIGEWDRAADALDKASHEFGLDDEDQVKSDSALLAALRGDADTARTLLTSLDHMHESEDPQDITATALVAGFADAAQNDPAGALREARVVLGQANRLGITASTLRWAWPLAARAAHELGDTNTLKELVAQLSDYPPGDIAPLQLAERDLVTARLAAARSDPDAFERFAQAIASLRTTSTPYHLALGLLDQAEHLVSIDDAIAARRCMNESREIANRLGCASILRRAKQIEKATDDYVTGLPTLE
jgi:class 3 adenylate cyclase/tetratricopeptide (TPR) repeat protein